MWTDDDITVEGDGEQIRDFVIVDDFVQAKLLVATSDDAVRKAFNVGTGDSITTRLPAETIRSVTDSDIVHVYP